MELNRNQYFFAGILLVLIGVQMRMVSSFVLTPEVTQMLAKPTAVAQGDSPPTLAIAGGGVLAPGAKKTVRPPEWLGWCLMSVGSVLILHSLAMKKPD
ncbi:hypothetical protein Pla123a_24880 [Posidoniimonas polymericola]|uniref:Uncharacterized protein n=1 Tax=Posidoniimonas polymericola TaxID=2528002 RepID=A0A5C5YQI2_9BACT|nr:hypothetical protein [Posidoniimonas polymericola]TWT77058.1 hypothetical protein Pla123a_24880 [Posidoniimonas polymericola]